MTCRWWQVLASPYGDDGTRTAAGGGDLPAHLACLRDGWLVTSRPQGRVSVVSPAHPELFALVTAAEKLLAATGDAVPLCPTYGEARRS